MKKIVIFILCLLAVLQCFACVSKDVYEQMRAEYNTLEDENESLQKQVDHLEYMVEIMSTPTPTSAPTVEATEALNDISVNLYSPNSAGGVDISIEAYNSGNKTIKYARFVVTPYNAVGDVMQCEIRRESTSKESLIKEPYYRP